MPTEINFYQIDDVITKSLAPLLIKVLDEKKKALIFCKNAAKLKEIDDSLWTYGKYKFIPHATEADKLVLNEFGWAAQPLAITTREENLNAADYLVLIDEAADAFISSFARVFYFCESLAAENIKEFMRRVKADGSKVNAYKKIEGKWVKE